MEGRGSGKKSLARIKLKQQYHNAISEQFEYQRKFSDERGDGR
jgi:hypothetical protein